jgi:hypothetical protein
VIVLPLNSAIQFDKHDILPNAKANTEAFGYAPILDTDLSKTAHHDGHLHV